MALQELEEDAQLAARLASLAELQPSQLGVADEFNDTRFNRWDAAQVELQELCACATPRAKMSCVMRFVLQLKQVCDMLAACLRLVVTGPCRA